MDERSAAGVSGGRNDFGGSEPRDGRAGSARESDRRGPRRRGVGKRWFRPAVRGRGVGGRRLARRMRKLTWASRAAERARSRAPSARAWRSAARAATTAASRSRTLWALASAAATKSEATSPAWAYAFTNPGGDPSGDPSAENGDPSAAGGSAGRRRLLLGGVGPASASDPGPGPSGGGGGVCASAAALPARLGPPPPPGDPVGSRRGGVRVRRPIGAAGRPGDGWADGRAGTPLPAGEPLGLPPPPDRTRRGSPRLLLRSLSARLSVCGVLSGG